MRLSYWFPKREFKGDSYVLYGKKALKLSIRRDPYKGTIEKESYVSKASNVFCLRALGLNSSL